MSNNSGWSEWTWTDDTRAWRARLDENGQYQYEWLDPAAPRADDVPDLVGAIRDLNIDEQPYGSYGGYAYSGAPGGAGVATATAPMEYGHGYHMPHSQAQPSSTTKKGKAIDSSSKSHKKSSQSSKPASSKKQSSRSKTGKGLSREYEAQEPFYNPPPQRPGDPTVPDDPEVFSEHTGAPDQQYPHPEAPSQFSPDGSGFEPGNAALPEPADQHDDYDASQSAYPTTGGGGYGYDQGDHTQQSTYPSSKKPKTSASSGKRKEGRRREKDRPTADYSEEGLHEDPDQALQEAMAGADGYDTGDPTAFQTPSSMAPPGEFPEDEDDGSRTPRGGSPVGGDDNDRYASGYGPGQGSSYPGHGGYATGQATGYSAPQGSGYPPVDDSGYLTAQTTDYSATQDEAYPAAYGSTYPAAPGGGFYGPGNPPVDANLASHGEELDSRYVLEPSSRFAPGEVFKVLWSEPLGSGRDNRHPETPSAPTEITERNNHLGQKFFVGFRRFIVVANDEGHCTSVPILTYERRGCTKRGVKPQKHGIVYPLGGRAVPLKNEPQLGYPPVRLQLDYPTEKLAKESRVNYSKLVTIEHNIKVFFIGRIIREDFDIVDSAVNECWDAKLRRAGESSRRHRR